MGIAEFFTRNKTATHSDHLESVLFGPYIDGTLHGVADKLGVPAILRARQMTADVMASLPYTAGDSPLPSPNSEQTFGDFVVETVLSLQDCGDAYWVRSGNDWYVLDPSRVTVRWDTNQITRRYYLDQNGTPLRTGGVVPNLMVVSVNRGPSDLTGVGWLESSRIRGIVAALDYAQKYYENNASPTGILTVPAMATEPETDALLKQWVEAQKVRTPAVVSSGITWDDTGFSPNDSQWVETHRLSVGDVALMAGIPGTLLDYNTPGASLTYQNVGDVESLWVRNTLYPYYGRRLVDAFTAMYDTLVSVNFEQLELAGLASRALAANQLVLAGYEPGSVAVETGLDTHLIPIPDATINTVTEQGAE